MAIEKVLRIYLNVFLHFSGFKTDKVVPVHLFFLCALAVVLSACFICSPLGAAYCPLLGSWDEWWFKMLVLQEECGPIRYSGGSALTKA